MTAHRSRTWTRALVTGASSGIGESIARILAAEGSDLVLVARRGDRLEALASELSVSVEVLVADLSDDGDMARVEARAVATDAPIDLVVANAGIAWIGNYIDMPPETLDTMVRLNVLSLARLVHAVVPGMVDAGHGGILMTSSTASFQPVPLSANYGATKAFVTSLSDALHAELHGTGVHVTALCPGPTETEIGVTSDVETNTPDFLSADSYSVAVAGLDGVAANKSIVIPGALNKIGATVPRFLPRMVMRRAVKGMYSQVTS